MKIALLIILSSLLAHATEPAPASPPMAMVTALREAEENWRAAQADLFTSGKKHVGTEVRCSGTPLSLKEPVTIKVAGGTTVRLTKLQGADRVALAAFRKPPSTVIARGPIIALDPATRTVTIKAVSTMFEQ